MPDVALEKLINLVADPKSRRDLSAAVQKADDDERLAVRREIIKRKNEDAEEAARILPALSKTVDDQSKRVDAAKKTYDSELDAKRGATGALLSASNKFERQRERFDAQLRETGDPNGRIAKFVQDLGEMWERERKLPSRSELRSTGKFLRGEFSTTSVKEITVPWSDHLSRARLLVAIRQAQAAAEALKLEALSAAEIEARLRMLAENLPEVVMENVAVDNVAA